MGWKIVDRESRFFEGVASSMVGFDLTDAPVLYTVENEETGERRQVKATDENDVGRKISQGDFYD